MELSDYQRFRLLSIRTFYGVCSLLVFVQDKNQFLAHLDAAIDVLKSRLVVLPRKVDVSSYETILQGDIDFLMLLRHDLS